MARQSPNSAARIQELKDAFRQSFVGGTVVVAAGFLSLTAERRGLILAKLQTFDQFNKDNALNREHDFGIIEDRDVRCIWKTDCYDSDMELMSSDPADPSVSTRVLTVMLAEEY
jgi:Protein of unknown function (DUF3768)